MMNEQGFENVVMLHHPMAREAFKNKKDDLFVYDHKTSTWGEVIKNSMIEEISIKLREMDYEEVRKLFHHINGF